MNSADRLYEISPIFVQNLLISTYGLYIRNLRYSNTFKSYLNFLMETESFEKEHINNLQSRYLTDILNHAYLYIPFYKKIFKERGIEPKDINIANISELLPITTKEEIRNNSNEFISNYYNKKNLIKLKTSGTTGSPLTIYATKEAIQKNYAFFARFLSWADIDIHDRSVTFAGRIIVPKKQIGPPYWRHNWSRHQMLCSSYNITEKSIPAYIRAIEKFNPIFIDSFPSPIIVISRYILENSYEHKIRPKAIITSSEVLLDHQRECIEKAFGCKVYDQYGSAEMAGFFAQCENGSYHVSPEYGLVEVVDQYGNSVPSDTSGDLICTGFLNNAMPFIRYKTGDSICLSSKSCSCGRKTPVVKSLLGRTDDLVITKDGKMISGLGIIFKSIRQIKEAQIIQESVEHITLNIVSNNALDEVSRNELLSDLTRRIGNDITVDIRQVDNIPRTRGGKTRTVISKVPHRYLGKQNSD